MPEAVPEAPHAHADGGDAPRARPRILVIYQYIALYRLPVFSELARSAEFDFTFMSGVEGHGETPKIADRPTLEAADFDWIPTRNVWLTGQVLWQPGVLPAVLGNRFDGVIFLGDMHYLSTWTAALLLKAMGKPFAFWTIGMHRPERGLRLAVRRFWHGLAGRVLVYGEYARSLMVGSGSRPDSVVVIGNSLDFERQSRLFHQLTPKPRQPEAVPTLIAIGRLTARRKLDRLIEAVADLRREGLELRLKLIGDGSERPALQALASRLSLEQVEFLGAVYDEAEIAAHVYEADLCVVPGIIGLGAVHAHSYGTPVITCGDWAIQAPEAEVIARGETGDFCAWDDTGSVAAAIRRWMEAGHDRETVRAACRRRVADRWTPAAQRAAIERALKPLFR